MEKQIAFRLYGDFLWPPVIGDLSGTKPSQRGVAEIWLVKNPKNPKESRTLLAWSKTVLDEAPDYNKTFPDVFNTKHEDLINLFQEPSKTIWVEISKLKNGRIGEILKFSGAVAYQQFNGTEQDEVKDEFICPLVSNYKNKKVCYSELIVGQTDANFKFFKFNIAIPVPIALTSLLSEECEKVFPLSCIYSSSYNFGRPNYFYVGPPDKDPENINPPKDFRLGKYGFCKSNFQSIKNYLVIPNAFWIKEKKKQLNANLDLFKTFSKDENLNNFDFPNSTIDEFSIKFSRDKLGFFDFEYKSKVYYNNPDSLEIKMAGEMNRTRPIGNDLRVEIKFSCAINQYFLTGWLLGGTEKLSYIYSPQLIWTETLKNERISKLLYEYMEIAKSLPKSLLLTTPTKPLTFLPNIVSVLTTDKVTYTLRPASNEFKVEIDKQLSIFNVAKNTDFYVTLCETDNNVIKVVASFPNFDTDETVELILKPHSGETNLPTPTLAIFDIEEIKSEKIPNIRLGDLKFVGVNSLFGGKSSIYLHPSLLDKNETSSIDVQFKAEIETRDVQPIVIDNKRGERRSLGSKLLIPVNQVTSNQGTFTLAITENLSTTQDWHLTASLYDKTPDDDSSYERQSYVVMSFEPYTIYRFNRIPLSNSGSIENNIIAEYDSDFGQWHLKKTSDYYHYIFPTQAIGEAADKPERLEVYDDIDSMSPPNKPYPYESKKGIKTTFLIEYRLTPSAEIWIKPSDLQRNYFLPEWNASDIFNERSSYTSFGAPLLAFRGEFLYGLSVGIDTTKEIGASKHARVAEIEALTGKYILKEFSNSLDSVMRWRKLIPVLKGRPERLEFWSYNQENETLSQSSFEKGVNFALRHTALHRPPIYNPDFENSLNQPEDEVKLKKNIHFHPQGLPGGALWPLEQWSILERLLEQPESTEGTISNIALTPTGGYANQKAKFLNGILSIASHTHLGFLNYQKIEVLGRIAGHWHKAKHVIIYKRTANIGPQFAPKPIPDNRHLHRTRRPVIRKVSEYIEITQPYRSYPDCDSSFMDVAPLEAIRYNSEIIYVDSAWGVDIPGLGYKIPLWNRYSAKERPQVYPKPCISVITLGECATDQSEHIRVAQDCKNPETIYFYTELSSKESNTDLWPIRLGIDCVKSLTSSTYLGDEEQDLNLGSDFKQESVTRSLPGLQQFTLQLMPGITKTRINAHRNDAVQERPIYASLESITFMRAAPSMDKSTEKVQTTLLEKLQDSKAIVNGLINISPLVSDDLEATKNQIRTSIHKLTDALNKAQSYKDEILANKDKVQNLPTCESFVKDAFGGLKRKRLLIRENLSVWQHEVIKSLDKVVTNTNKDNVRANLVESIVNYIKPSIDQAYNAFDHINKEFEHARGIAQDLQNEIIIALNQGLKRLAAIEQAYQDGTPWSGARLASFEQKIRAEIVSIKRSINTALRELSERLTLELSNQVNQISKELNDAIAKEVKNIFAELDAYEKDLDGQFVFLKTLLLKQIDFIDEKLLELRSKSEEIKGVEGVSDDSKKLINKFISLIDGLLEQSNDIKASISTLSNPNIEKFKQISSDISELLSNIQRNCTEDTKELLEKLSQEIPSDALLQQFETISQSILDKSTDEILTIWSNLKNNLEDLGKVVNPIVESAQKLINKLLKNSLGLNTKFNNQINSELNSISDELKDFKKKLEPSTLIKTPVQKYVDLILDQIDFKTIGSETKQLVDILELKLNNIVEDITGTGGLLDSIGQVENIVTNNCSAVDEFLKSIGQSLENEITKYSEELNDLKQKVEEGTSKLKEALIPEDINQIRNIINQIDLNQLSQDIKNTYAHADTYSRRIIDAATSLGSGSAEQLPGKLLRIHSAVVNAPELSMIEANIDRMRLAYDNIDKLIKTTPARMVFSRLGDKLKALGLDFPFDGLSSTFKFDKKALEKFDISKLLKNFAGLNGLIKGKIPSNIAEAVKISHEFDKKQSRAWVQIDINLSLFERRELVSISPFAMYLKESELVASVRLTASADSDKIDESGFAYINTSIETVVSGQQIVTLEKVKISHSQSGGLNFEFNPQNIKLNPGFKFIQDTLKNIFPHEVGGINIIKQNGIPIGMEHEFIMPNLSLSYGTSGVSNIQLSNRFKLIAVPNFYIANRFNISSPELPFIFSFFILGGTGYGIVEVEYHPLSEELTVYIEIAAGGSAALAFSFGPVNGSVFITLSFALKYKKISTQSSGSLAISLVLLIAGVVRVFSLVNVYLGLLLRLCYHENGQIDGRGDLFVEVRISRFFKLKYRSTVTYKLRDGNTSSESSQPQTVTFAKAKRINDARV